MSCGPRVAFASQRAGNRDIYERNVNGVTYDKLATLTLGPAGGRGVSTPLESPLGKWAYDSLQKTSESGAPVRRRMMGGSVPTDSLVEILGAPFVIVPLVNGDNNQHTFDENMRVGHYVEGVRTIVGMLREPAR